MTQPQTPPHTTLDMGPLGPHPDAMVQTQTLSPTPDGIDQAAALLRAGRLVAFPTETVYGLGGDATNGAAVAAIYAAKGRPSFNPLIAHVPDLTAAEEIAVIDETARQLATLFWPGPLTLVLPLRPGHPIASLVTAGLDTLAVRVSAHPLARDVLTRVGRPVAAPSANPSGRISPTRATHVMDGLAGAIDAVLDGGPCDVGVESTILQVTDKGITLLRPGGLSADAITAATGQQVLIAQQEASAPTAPGQLLSHYAPRAPLRMNADGPEGDEVYLGFGPGSAAASLSPSGDLVEAAATLFDLLHQLDKTGRPIAVAPIPDHGLGQAINDRLRRAAAPRD